MMAPLKFLVRLGARQNRGIANRLNHVFSLSDRQVMKVRKIPREKESGSLCCCLRLGPSCKAQRKTGSLTSCLLVKRHWLVELS